MKLNLITKFLCIYIAISILGFIGVSSIIYRIDYNNVHDEEEDNLYRQAVSIARNLHPTILIMSG